MDADGDSYCAGYADCDDTDDDINPAATEICDGIDNNCNGLIDEGCPHPDYNALVALYNATNGVNWTSPWDLNNPDVCTWPGVFCNGNNRVVTLFLVSQNLDGQLPPEIGSLPELQRLEIKQNSLLTGGIPAEIGNLSNLTILNLYNNNLSGTIPSEVGNLSNLTDLTLSNNQITGITPSQIGGLSNLKKLRLNNNQLNGNIPSEIGNLNNLTILLMNSNSLDGCFPSELNVFCSGPSVSFSNNPNLPGGGNFTDFCNTGNGADADGDSYCAGYGDCDDTDANSYTGAPEICDGKDNDCNGSPEAASNTWTGNGDGTSWNDPANWSDGIVPLECQDVMFPPTFNITVGGGIPAVGNTLDVNLGSTLSVPVPETMSIGN